MPTLALYGPEDHVVWRNFPDEVRRSPLPSASDRSSCRGAGHFLQWERAGVLNRALTHFFADLR